jgi:hypothetical protein
MCTLNINDRAVFVVDMDGDEPQCVGANRRVRPRRRPSIRAESQCVSTTKVIDRVVFIVDIGWRRTARRRGKPMCLPPPNGIGATVYQCIGASPTPKAIDRAVCIAGMDTRRTAWRKGVSHTPTPKGSDGNA